MPWPGASRATTDFAAAVAAGAGCQNVRLGSKMAPETDPKVPSLSSRVTRGFQE